ncbi:hypothetical protein KC338_g264 [Hortaea werneckii]|nr:hypothetical protein KC338_g264 [Hortaea werneckii]
MAKDGMVSAPASTQATAPSAKLLTLQTALVYASGLEELRWKDGTVFLCYGWRTTSRDLLSNCSAAPSNGAETSGRATLFVPVLCLIHRLRDISLLFFFLVKLIAPRADKRLLIRYFRRLRSCISWGEQDPLSRSEAGKDTLTFRHCTLTYIHTSPPTFPTSSLHRDSSIISHSMSALPVATADFRPTNHLQLYRTPADRRSPSTMAA